MFPRKYDVRLLPQAFDDLDALYRYIAGELFAPATADKYIDGIYHVIDRLAYHANVFAATGNESLRRLYGTDVRVVCYKKMSVVYSIIGGVVLIRRVMPGSVIR